MRETRKNVSDETKLKMSNSQKGRIHNNKSKDKIRESKLGKNNPMSVKWLLVSPDGERHYLAGNLKEFCEKHSLSRSTLRLYAGRQVDDIPKFYRHRGSLLHIRKNTIGWTLYKDN